MRNLRNKNLCLFRKSRFSLRFYYNTISRIYTEKKNYCISQPDCRHRTDKLLLLSQQNFSSTNKPFC